MNKNENTISILGLKSLVNHAVFSTFFPDQKRGLEIQPQDMIKCSLYYRQDQGINFLHFHI